MEQISKLVFISNQKLLILSTYSVIATILLINSALYIIPVILIIMGNCFWFYFCAAWASVRWSIINTSPPPSSHAPRWLSFWAASRSWPKAATGGARGKLHKTIRSSRLWDFNSFDFSRARDASRATSYRRETTADNELCSGTYTGLEE